MTTARHIKADAIRFGKVVQRRRLQEGWSIAELGRRSGFSSKHLSLIEQGRNMPSLNMLLMLAEVFHVDASDMLREFEQSRREAKAHRAATMLAAAGLTPASEG
jgi:transcriptional regulator with XRE-family HTH domain